MQQTKKDSFSLKFPAVESLIRTMPDDIWESCISLSLKPWDILFTQGERISRIYLVCSGMISVYETDLSGNEAQVVIVEDGGILGEMEALNNKKFARFSAKAITPCCLLSLPLTEFFRWMQHDISLCLLVTKILAAKLSRASGEAVLHVRNKTIEILSARLLLLKTGLITLTRQELAIQCGASVRTINRAIRQLSQEGYLDIVHGKISISPEQKEILAASEYVLKFKDDFH